MVAPTVVADTAGAGLPQCWSTEWTLLQQRPPASQRSNAKRHCDARSYFPKLSSCKHGNETNTSCDASRLQRVAPDHLRGTPKREAR
jgi:hypothetical protein